MISDDIKNDDIPEDDFDLDGNFDDDFDDEILEDDWDEAADGNSDLALSIEDGAQTEARSEKTFLQKYFTAIVAGIAILFALVFALGQGFFGGSSPTQEQQNVRLVASEDTNAVENTDSLPVLAETEQSNDTDVALEALEPMPTDDNALTPLPGDSDVETFELVDLEAELANTDNALEEVSIDDVLATPPLEDSPPVLDEDVKLEDELALNDNDALNTADDDLMFENTAIEDNISDSEADLTLSLEETDVSEDANDVAIISNDQSAKIESLESENLSLTEGNENLKSALESSENTIQTLRDEIAALQKSLKNAQQTAPKVVKEQPTQAKPKVQEKPAVSTAVPKAKVKAVKWVLKSAQPGKATISAQGSNDLRNIEVGNVITGLGRIKSISVENGLWVVRGTRGQVSQ